ncbi:sulfatase [Lacunimicrobium album]
MLRTVMLLALVLMPLCACAQEKEKGAKYNVLFLMCDDLNVDLGCYGHPIVKSPHIDALAKESVTFDHAYCQYPLCSPSRTSMLTGKRPDETRVYDLQLHFRKVLPDVVTLPQYFMGKGYTVSRIGKLYHYGVPGQIGTDGLDDPESWQSKFNPIGRDKADESQVFSFEPGKYGGTLSWLAAEGDDSEQTDGIAAAYACEWLEKHRDEPFFLGCGFYRPHTPFVSPKKYFEMYPKEDLVLPKVPEGHDSRVPKFAVANRKKYEAELTDEDRLNVLQAYYASISFADAQVGIVLNKLKELGLWDKTIVVLTSDHGYHMGEHHLWQKMSVFEKSARVPLLIHHPAFAKDQHAENSIVELLDLYPTLVDGCGYELPAGLSGTSLVPALRDPTKSAKNYAITRVNRGNNAQGFSLRTPQYRYTEWRTKDGIERELYDHSRDHDEYANLANEPTQKGVMDALSLQMNAILERQTIPPETLKKPKG